MRQFQYLKEFLIIFEEFLALTGGEVIPCTSTEVDILESMLPHPYRLPLAYKEFLLYGGHRMGKLTSAAELYYGAAEIELEDGYNEFWICRLRALTYNIRLPSDIFVIMEHQAAHYKFFLLTEGEDPPVYIWNEKEDGKGGLVDCPKYDSFSDYLKWQLRIATGYKLGFSRRDVEAGNHPRGKKFWVPVDRDFQEGITRNDLIGAFGYIWVSTFEEDITKAGLDPDSYLEELSGWRKRQVTENGTTTTRFFPPETKEE
jgi:SMI1-KNR4 cell-wall